MDLLKHKILLLNGNWNQRYLAIEKLKKSFEDVEITIINNSCSYAFFEQSILQESCFTSIRIILVNELPKFTFSRPILIKNLTGLIDKIPLNCLVILNGIAISAKKLIAKIKENGNVINFPKEIDFAEAVDMMQKWMSMYKKNIDGEVLHTFIRNIFTDQKKMLVDKLYLQMQKLMHVVGNKDIIDENDIINVSYHDQNFIVWTLIDHLDKKNIKAILDMISVLSMQSGNLESEIIGIFNILLWKYKLLLYIIDGKGRITDIKRNIGCLKKLERQGVRSHMHFNVPDESKTIYSANMVQYTTKLYNEPRSILKSITIEKILHINNFIRNCLVVMRSSKIEGKALVFLKLISMFVCDIIKDINILYDILNAGEVFAE